MIKVSDLFQAKPVKGIARPSRQRPLSLNTTVSPIADANLR